MTYSEQVLFSHSIKKIMIVKDASRVVSEWRNLSTLAQAKATANKTFIVRASLTIVTYYGQDSFTCVNVKKFVFVTDHKAE